MVAKALLGAAVVLVAAGCANRCDYALTRCQYLCNRDYQVCQLHGNDEFYCANEIANCRVECDAERHGCRSWL